MKRTSYVMGFASCNGCLRDYEQGDARYAATERDGTCSPECEVIDQLRDLYGLNPLYRAALATAINALLFDAEQDFRFASRPQLPEEGALL